MAVAFTVRLKIRRPPADVFAAVADPAILTRYFVASPSGPAAAGHDTRAEFAFTPLNAADTLAAVTESGWPTDKAGLAASHNNAGGWMHMLACLKAWLEYGINLREGGAF